MRAFTRAAALRGFSYKVTTKSMPGQGLTDNWQLANVEMCEWKTGSKK
jgi:hypothetical protein